MLTLYRIAFAPARRSYHNGAKLSFRSRKWIIFIFRVCSVLHFDVVCHRYIRTVAEVNKEGKGAESAKTEVNFRQWGLGFSSPNPLVKPLRRDVRFVPCCDSASYPGQFALSELQEEERDNLGEFSRQAWRVTSQDDSERGCERPACSSSVPMLFMLYRIAFRVGKKSYPV